MTDHEEPILFKRTEAPGQIFGVPNRDLKAYDVDRLLPDLRREVKASALYAAVGTDEALDLLGELDNAAYAALSPAEKGARTKEANKRAELSEADRLEREALAAAEADTAAKAAHDAGETGHEEGA